MVIGDTVSPDIFAIGEGIALASCGCVQARAHPLPPLERKEEGRSGGVGVHYLLCYQGGSLALQPSHTWSLDCEPGLNTVIGVYEPAPPQRGDSELLLRLLDDPNIQRLRIPHYL